MKMIFVKCLEEWPAGFDTISTSDEWSIWIRSQLPKGLDREVRRRLISNLKHILVSMDLKAALVLTHQMRQKDQRPVLYEPYLQSFIREFCNDAVSVLEGLGSALVIGNEPGGGSEGRRVGRNEWQDAICATYDSAGTLHLRAATANTIAVRDRIHQDRLGLRDNIDWHSFGYEEAFLPAIGAMKAVFSANAGALPEKTYMRP